MGFPDKLILNDKLVYGSKKVADGLNEFYKNKISDLITKIPKTNFDPIAHYKQKIKKPKKILKIKKINTSQLVKTIGNMKNTNSFGYYGISMSMIKNHIKVLSPLLLNLVNQVIEKEKFPENIKIQKVVPIAKNYDFLNPNSYRGINILSPISKIIENVLKNQIIEFLNTNNIIPLNHLGGIKGRS